MLHLAWRRRSFCLGIVAATLQLLSGCVRQDTEILARVGRKLADNTRESTAALRERLPFQLPRLGPESLQQRVEMRLRTDKALQGLTIGVDLKDTDVELKGNVHTDEQKRRAVDLAESTEGVGRVLDSLQLGP